MGVNGDKFSIMAEHKERAETLIKSGQAFELPESIWELDPSEMATEAKRIMKEKINGTTANKPFNVEDYYPEDQQMRTDWRFFKDKFLPKSIGDMIGGYLDMQSDACEYKHFDHAKVIEREIERLTEIHENG